MTPSEIARREVEQAVREHLRVERARYWRNAARPPGLKLAMLAPLYELIAQRKERGESVHDLVIATREYTQR